MKTINLLLCFLLFPVSLYAMSGNGACKEIKKEVKFKIRCDYVYVPQLRGNVFAILMLGGLDKDIKEGYIKGIIPTILKTDKKVSDKTVAVIITKKTMNASWAMPYLRYCAEDGTEDESFMPCVMNYVEYRDTGTGDDDE